MDIKASIEKAVNMLMTDKNLMAEFEKNPASVIEQIVGVDLPDEIVNQIVSGIKVKLAATQVGNALEGIGKLFKK